MSGQAFEGEPIDRRQSSSLERAVFGLTNGVAYAMGYVVGFMRYRLFENMSLFEALEAFAQSKSISMQQSGSPIQTANNSHGEILRRFVLEHPQCAYYLFLDADTCFVQEDTIDRMMRELEKDSTAFGIGPRLSWDGQTELPEEVHKKNPDVYVARLHPCCALVRNTELFRNVVQEIASRASNTSGPRRKNIWTPSRR